MREEVLADLRLALDVQLSETIMAHIVRSALQWRNMTCHEPTTNDCSKLRMEEIAERSRGCRDAGGDGVLDRLSSRVCAERSRHRIAPYTIQLGRMAVDSTPDTS